MIESLTNLIPEGRLGIVIIAFVIYMMVFTGRTILPLARKYSQNKLVLIMAFVLDVVVNFVFAIIALKFIVTIVYGGIR